MGASTPVWGLVLVMNLGVACAQSEKAEDRDTLQVTAPKTTLRVGETVQLKVLQRLPDGSVRDLTDASTGTIYYTTSESMLVPESDGQVTCIGTRERPRESAIISAKNGLLFGSIRFKLIAGGPGPRLMVVADRLVLLEGERAQLRVYRPIKGAAPQEVTPTSAGTRYLIFPGSGRHDPSDLSIDDQGVTSAPTSIGRLTRLPVIVFVRNGELAGWIKLTVVPAKKSP